MITAYQPIHFNLLYTYYKEKTLSDGFFVLLETDTFKSYLDAPCFISIENGVMDGFILGNTVNDIAYIDYLYAENDPRGLILAFEDFVQTFHIREILISFRSKIKKAFYVQDSDIHMNAQGLSLESPYLDIFIDRGYDVTSYQSTYHLDLSKYALPHDLSALVDKQKEANIHVGFYSRSDNLDYFIKALGNSDFATSIMNNQNATHPNPLLVGVSDGKVIGFAGPISVKDRRGVFHGISVLAPYQGHKVGKVLFNLMCHHLKEMGATYITLFTGDDNPARFLYLNTGFVKKHTFMMLKKEL